jgi:hypothetical protein
MCDKIIVDFSPLRTEDIGEVVRKLKEESLLYDDSNSLIGISDFSNINDLGWNQSDVRELFANQPIWRIPVFGVSFSFKDRSKCKKFAEEIANRL